jgi:hypothetical protein
MRVRAYISDVSMRTHIHSSVHRRGAHPPSLARVLLACAHRRLVSTTLARPPACMRCAPSACACDLACACAFVPLSVSSRCVRRSAVPSSRPLAEPLDSTSGAPSCLGNVHTHATTIHHTRACTAAISTMNSDTMRYDQREGPRRKDEENRRTHVARRASANISAMRGNQLSAGRNSDAIVYG